jgi:hypothetical protein
MGEALKSSGVTIAQRALHVNSVKPLIKFAAAAD